MCKILAFLDVLQFEFSDWLGKVCYVLGILGAVGNGLCNPLMSVFLGDMLDLYVGVSSTNVTSTQLGEFQLLHPDCFDGNAT